MAGDPPAGDPRGVSLHFSSGRGHPPAGDTIPGDPQGVSLHFSSGSEINVLGLR
jgi:hypothetical protein